MAFSSQAHLPFLILSFTSFTSSPSSPSSSRRVPMPSPRRKEREACGFLLLRRRHHWSFRSGKNERKFRPAPLSLPFPRVLSPFPRSASAFLCPGLHYVNGVSFPLSLSSLPRSRFVFLPVSFAVHLQTQFSRASGPFRVALPTSHLGECSGVSQDADWQLMLSRAPRYI